MDGCSAECKVEQFYQCSNNNSQESTCQYVGIPLNLSLNYVEREGAENRGRFVFAISPSLIFLNKIDFGSRASLICDSDYLM